MKIIRGLINLTPISGCALTIGNFDGVHLGHQAIIKKVVDRAKTLGVPSMVISFSPTPQQFFGKAQARLSSFRQKHQKLEALGVDIHLIIRFNEQLAKQGAVDFVNTLLVEKLSTQYCLIGDDFRFGAGRLGDFDLLTSLGKQHGFSVENTQSIELKGMRISSSNIRQCLSQGLFNEAEAMLGNPFAIEGKIISGQQLGRTINFPTINVAIKRRISPVLGVFAVRVQIADTWHQGVCNVGSRPTVNGKGVLAEAFIFNFDQEVYGQYAKIVLVHKIRSEQKFDSFDALRAQIQQDVDAAKEFFGL